MTKIKIRKNLSFPIIGNVVLLRSISKGVSDECREEGYPSHGSNYGLRYEAIIEALRHYGYSYIRTPWGWGLMNRYH